MTTHCKTSEIMFPENKATKICPFYLGAWQVMISPECLRISIVSSVPQFRMIPKHVCVIATCFNRTTDLLKVRGVLKYLSESWPIPIERSLHTTTFNKINHPFSGEREAGEKKKRGGSGRTGI